MLGKKMKRLLFIAPLVVLAACSDTVTSPSPAASLASSSAADPALSGNKLQCYSYAPSTCTLTLNGADVSSVSSGATFLWIDNSNLQGRRVTEINRLAFTYSGTGAAGGSPRLTFPLDQNGDGVWTQPHDDYVSIDWNACGLPAAGGTVDVINDANCKVATNGIDGSSETYANWAAFIAANPTQRVATGEGYVPFIILDASTGNMTISNVELGRSAGKSRP